MCSSAANVPLILRPIGGHFWPIGDAYIHGIMHGEAIDGVENGLYTLRDFKIG
jgi:hypothetical protein